MAEARHRAGLSGALDSRAAGVWTARAGAFAALVALCALGFRDLRLSGFRFRWETGPSSSVAPPGSAARVARRVESLPASAPGDGRSTPAVTAPEPPPVEGDRAPPGAGRPATIDFETLADGSAFPTPCAVSSEWAGDGLLVSFRSWSADGTTPYVLDGRDYLPPDASQNALGPAFRPDRGLEVGVIRLDFPGRPRTVAFTLYGPDIVPRFEIVAWTGVRVMSGAVTQVRVRTYDIAGRGRFREERVTVRAAAGIDRVSLDGWGPPGHLVLVDDLAIMP